MLKCHSKSSKVAEKKSKNHRKIKKSQKSCEMHFEISASELNPTYILHWLQSCETGSKK